MEVLKDLCVLEKINVINDENMVKFIYEDILNKFFDYFLFVVFVF